MSRQLTRCASCASPLPGRRNARYCTPECRHDAYRSRKRVGADSRRCQHCGLPLEASKRLNAKYCGDACRQAARRGSGIPKRKAHQAREHGTHRLSGYRVLEIDTLAAKLFIVEHEWLGTMPSSPQACYGLFSPVGSMVGVAVFGRGSEPMRREFGSRSIALERGAVISGEPRNAGSFLISRAVRLAMKTYGWTTFVAWADARAGETGAIYRAANWRELPSRGGNTRTEYRRPDGAPVSERAARAFAKALGVTIPALVSMGWRRELVPRKRRFVRGSGQ